MSSSRRWKDDSDDEETDDEMPPLELAETTTSSPPAAAAATTPTRRIIRAIRPKSNERSTTHNGPGSSIPMAVDWNLFPSSSPGGDGQPPPVMNGTAQEFLRRNGPPSSPIETAEEDSDEMATIEMEALENEASRIFKAVEDEDETDEDMPALEEEEDHHKNPNNNPFAALQSDDSEGSYEEDDEDDEDEDYEDDDEILSYHSSEFEESEEEEEESDDDDDDQPEMPPGMLNFFRMMHQLDNDSDNDDDDDDSGPCTCPHCLLERLGAEPSDSEAEEDESPPLDPTASPCAICMEHETTQRTFVHLPCCGNADKEAAYSMRFCKKCLVRYLAKNGCGVPKTTTVQSDAGLLAGECPRCKQLLILDEVAQDDRPYYQRTKAAVASTQSLYWYIGRKEGGQYRIFLLTLGWCAPHYIPEELLLNDSKSAERIAHLCQWGILRKLKKSTTQTTNNVFRRLTTRLFQWLHSKVPLDKWGKFLWQPHDTPLPNVAGEVYAVHPQAQHELRTLLLEHLEIDVDDDLQLRLNTPPCEHVNADNARKQCFMVACNCAASAWMALSKFRILRAIRILNRGVTLGLLSSKCLLPPVAEWPATLPKQTYCWHAMTLLNWLLVLVALRIAGKAIWIGVYLAQAVCACQLVGTCIVPPKSAWKQCLRNVSLVYGAIYGLYQMGVEETTLFCGAYLVQTIWTCTFAPETKWQRWGFYGCFLCSSTYGIGRYGSWFLNNECDTTADLELVEGTEEL